MSIEDGGVYPHVFDLIIHHTLAVLGPTAHQSSNWQNNFVELRNQATSGGDTNMVALLTPVIELLDARGNGTERSKEIDDKSWQAIVGRLPTCIEPNLFIVPDILSIFLANRNLVM